MSHVTFRPRIIGSFVSGLAVLISLIYLAVQVQQAERNQKAQIQQGRAARMVDLQLHLAEPNNADIMLRGLSGEEFASALDLQRFRNLAMAVLYSVEDTFLQHQNGLLDDSEFDGFRMRMAGLFANTGFRAIWSDLRLFHGGAFREFFDDIERTSVTSTNPLERWRESLVRVSHR